ncbi:hypothetical protein [Spiroplasma floricola]|uniref:DUF4064 domain-containing protein n=1 Tax=Spiroplasma floricola 23-6 TaxID=1336749 RepID=A0A2K8SCG6_9MOLU|nr:hypothetical protein [Spiroplasma floricola]AUB31143.1 hypothetical protein SFLOR_v1c00820 [Spiroplasma floricola 23-6]
MNKTAKSLGLAGAIVSLGLIITLIILAVGNQDANPGARFLIFTMMIILIIGFGVSLGLNIAILVMLSKKDKDNYAGLGVFQIVIGGLSLLFGQLISGGLTLASGIILMSTPVDNQEKEKKDRKVKEIEEDDSEY